MSNTQGCGGFWGDKSSTSLQAVCYVHSRGTRSCNGSHSSQRPICGLDRDKESGEGQGSREEDKCPSEARSFPMLLHRSTGRRSGKNSFFNCFPHSSVPQPGGPAVKVCEYSTCWTCSPSCLSGVTRGE